MSSQWLPPRVERSRYVKHGTLLTVTADSYPDGLRRMIVPEETSDETVALLEGWLEECDSVARKAAALSQALGVVMIP